jgi:selenocysteine lyase/cysteine desulfurase
MNSVSKMQANSTIDLLPEVLEFRKRFPIFKNKIHLANNAMGGICDVTEQAHRDYLDDRIEHGASWEVAIPKHEKLRHSFADFIGAKPNEIAICYAATQALGSLTTCFNWEDKSSVVVDDYSFPSVAQLWHAQEQRGAKVRRVAEDEDGLILPEYFDAALDGDVKLASVAQVCYKNGHLLDVAEVGKRVHDAGALYVVDAYQGCGSREINVRDLDIDIMVAGTVKYMLGSPGVGLMYVKEELLDQLHPTVTGWFAQATPGAMYIDKHEEAPDAVKFQSGTPALSPVYDSLAGLELIKSIGIRKIETWIEYMTARVMERLLEEGFVSATPLDPARRSAQVAIHAKDDYAAVSELAKRGITSTCRDNKVRTAWHFYNTPDDIESLITALKDIRHLMA